jgi:tRNA (Thr-GGU) A37 N-methylase
VVRLLSVNGATLAIAGIDLLDLLDLLDLTPVLDIKRYVPEFGSVVAERTGWLQGVADRVHSVKSDRRPDQP